MFDPSVNKMVAGGKMQSRIVFAKYFEKCLYHNVNKKLMHDQKIDLLSIL